MNAPTLSKNYIRFTFTIKMYKNLLKKKIYYIAVKCILFFIKI